MVEVNDGDACADTVCVRHKVGVHALLRVAEMGPGSDESGEGDVVGCYGSVECMVRLERIIPCLGRAILREGVDFVVCQECMGTW